MVIHTLSAQGHQPPDVGWKFAFSLQISSALAWKSIVLEARVKYCDFVPKYHHEVSWSRPRRPLSFLCFAAERRAAPGPGRLCVSKVIGGVGGVWWETTQAAQISRCLGTRRQLCTEPNLQSQRPKSQSLHQITASRTGASAKAAVAARPAHSDHSAMQRARE